MLICFFLRLRYLGGIVYHHVWLENAATVEPYLSAGVITGILYVCSVGARRLIGFPAVARFPYADRLLGILPLTALFIAGSLFFMKGNIAFPAAPCFGFFAKWSLGNQPSDFRQGTRGLLLAESLDGRRVVTIGEPPELLGSNTTFLLRYCGLREVRRVQVATIAGVTGRGPGALDGALAAAREHGAEEIPGGAALGSQELLETIRSAFANRRFRSGFYPTITSEPAGAAWSSTDGLPLPVTIQSAPFDRVRDSGQADSGRRWCRDGNNVFVATFFDGRDRHQAR